MWKEIFRALAVAAVATVPMAAKAGTEKPVCAGNEKLVTSTSAILTYGDAKSKVIESVISPIDNPDGLKTALYFKKGIEVPVETVIFKGGSLTYKYVDQASKTWQTETRKYKPGEFEKPATVAYPYGYKIDNPSMSYGCMPLNDYEQLFPTQIASGSANMSGLMVKK